MATPNKPRLLASSGTADGIRACMEKFYCGTKCTFNEAGEVIRLSDGKVLAGVQVVCRGRRFRFEMITPPR